MLALLLPCVLALLAAPWLGLAFGFGSSLVLSLSLFLFSGELFRYVLILSLWCVCVCGSLVVLACVLPVVSPVACHSAGSSGPLCIHIRWLLIPSLLLRGSEHVVTEFYIPADGARCVFGTESLLTPDKGLTRALGCCIGALDPTIVHDGSYACLIASTAISMLEASTAIPDTTVLHCSRRPCGDIIDVLVTAGVAACWARPQTVRSSRSVAALAARCLPGSTVA